MLLARRRRVLHKFRPPSWDRSILVCSNLALVLEPKAWMMVQSSSRFWNRSDAKMSLTSCGVNLCFARRHKVAKPNCAFVFRAGF